MRSDGSKNLRARLNGSALIALTLALALLQAPVHAAPDVDVDLPVDALTSEQVVDVPLPERSEAIVVDELPTAGDTSPQAPPPMPTNIAIVGGADGFINAAEAPAVTVTGDAPGGAVKVFGRIVVSSTCDIGASLTTPVLEAPVVGGSWTLGSFDVSSFPEGSVLCARVRSENALAESSPSNVSAGTPVLDQVAPAAGAITIADPNSDGFMNASEASSGLPVSWTNSDSSAVRRKVWFTDSAGSSTSGCGPFENTNVNGSGSVNPTCAGSMAQGAFLARVTFRDQAGNWSTEATDSLVKDTIAPSAPTVSFQTSPITDANQASVAIAGTAEADSLVKIVVTDGSSTLNGQQTASGGSYSTVFDMSGLSDGTLTATATATDAAGNVGASASDSAVKDTTADVPSVDIVVAFVNAANQSAVDVVVDGEDGSSVDVTLTDEAGGSVSGSVVLSSPATVTLDASSLADGVVTATAVLTDPVGNTSGSASDTAVKDTAAPAVGGVAFHGAYAADGFINAVEAAAADPGGRPVAWTAGSADATAAQGRFTDDTDTKISGGNCGVFSLAPNGTTGYLNLSCMGVAPEGEIRWQVRWRDAAGNWSEWASASIVVDRVAPVASISLADGDGKVTTPEANGGVPVSWSVSEAGPGVRVFARNAGEPVPSGCEWNGLPRSTTGAITPACFAALAEGALEVGVEGVDEAGNPASALDTSVIDRIGPPAPIVTVVTDPINAANQGSVEVTIEGEAGSDAELTLSDENGNSVSASGTLNSSVSVTVDTSSLDDGTITATATLTDGDGNVSDPGATTATKDTVAPDPGTVAIDDGDGYVNAAEAASGVPATWSGPADAVSATVWFEDSLGNIPTGCGPFSVGANGTGSLNPTCAGNLPQGQLFFKGTWEDAAGNVSSDASDDSVKDTIAPVATITLLDGDGKVTSPEATTGVHVTWSMTESGPPVRVFARNPGVPVPAACDWQNQPRGPVTGSITPACWAALTDGTVRIRLTGTDDAGNPANATDTTLLDRLGPPAPAVVLTDPINIANHTAVSVEVSGQDGSEAAVSLADEDGTTLIDGGVLAGGSATFVFDTSSLIDGTITATVVLTDADGNDSEPGTDSATKDTVAPDAGSAAFSGAYADDGFINAVEAAAADPSGRPVVWTGPGQDEVAAQGRFTDPSDAVISGGNCGPFSLGTTGTGSNGWLNLSCMAASPEGEIRWQVRWRDAAGNWSEWASASIVVDRIAPDVSITSPSNGDTFPPGSTVTIEGATEAGAPLTYVLDSAPAGTGTADATGAFSTSVSGLADGVHVFEVGALDPAGNPGSATVTFEIDRLIPIILGPEEGAKVGGTVTIYGTGLRASDIEIYEGSRLVGSTTVDSRGDWVLITGMDDGEHTITARGKTADRTSVSSAPRTFEVDNGRPTVTITTANNSFFTDGPVIQGTATDAAEGVAAIEVSYYNLAGTRVFHHEAACTQCGPGATAVDWQSDPDLPVPGIYTVVARARDAVGQYSQEKTIRIVVVVLG